MLGTDRDGGTWIEFIPPVMDLYTERSIAWTTDTIDLSEAKKDRITFYAALRHKHGNAVIYLVNTEKLLY